MHRRRETSSVLQHVPQTGSIRNKTVRGVEKHSCPVEWLQSVNSSPCIQYSQGKNRLRILVSFFMGYQSCTREKCYWDVYFRKLSAFFHEDADAFVLITEVFQLIYTMYLPKPTFLELVSAFQIQYLSCCLDYRQTYL